MNTIEEYMLQLMFLFTFPSSGLHTGDRHTSLDKNVVDLAFKSYVLSARWDWQSLSPFWVMSMCLYAAQQNESQPDCLGVIAVQILNYNYANKHKNAVDALSLEIGAQQSLSMHITQLQ